MVNSNQRLDGLEKEVEGLKVSLNSLTEQFGDIRKEMMRLEFSIGGLRDQAKAHSERAESVMKEMRLETGNAISGVGDLVSRSTSEIQGSVDRLISVFGLDEDPKAIFEVRKDFAYLRSRRTVTEENQSWVRKSAIGLIVLAIASILLGGTVAFISQSSNHTEERR